MKELNTGKGFALALFEVATEKNQLEEVYSDLAILEKIAEEEPGLLQLFITPMISKKKKELILDKIFKNKVCDVLYDFFWILFERNGFDLFNEVCVEFRIYFSMYASKFHGIIYTSKKFDSTTIKKISEKVSSKLEMDHIQLDQVVDKGLISGFKIIVNGNVLDYSIKGKMESLKNHLLRKEF